MLIHTVLLFCCPLSGPLYPFWLVWAPLISMHFSLPPLGPWARAPKSGRAPGHLPPLSPLSAGLIILKDWFDMNKLSINIEKTNFILFKGRRVDMQLPAILLGNMPLVRVKETKFLGVFIDENLSWHNQTQSICKKLSSLNFVLSKIRHCINQATALKIYDALFLPHLTYCNIIWGMPNKGLINDVSKLQKRALRLCCNKYDIGSNSLFLYTSKIPFSSIHDFEVAMLCHTYFYNTKPLPDCLLLLFKKPLDVHSHSTRFAETISLLSYGSRLQIRKNSLKVYAPTLWNGLPIEIREIGSPKLFKEKLSSYLRIKTS